MTTTQSPDENDEYDENTGLGVFGNGKDAPDDEATQSPRSSSPAPAWTPGPWKAHDIQRNGIPYSPVTATTMIAKVYPTTYGDDAQSQANARLIAAAPEMARTIQSLTDCLESWWEAAGSPDHATEIELIEARALLARINGEGGGV